MTAKRTLHHRGLSYGLIIATLLAIMLVFAMQTGFHASASAPGQPPARPENGAPLTSWFPVSMIGDAPGSVDEGKPAVTYNSSLDEFLVVWQEVAYSGQIFLFGSRRDGLTGAQVGDNFQIQGCGESNYSPDAVYNPATGQYLVVSAYTGSTFHGICGTRIGADGSFIGLGSVTVDLTAAYYDPAVAFESASGKFLVVWQKTVGTATQGIEARAVYGSGDLNGEVVEVTGQLASNEPQASDVGCVSSTSNCLVAWEQWYGTSQNTHDIMGRLVHIGDTPANQGSIFPVMTTIHDDINPAVASMMDGTRAQFVVVNTTDYSPWKINLAGFDGNGGIDYGITGPLAGDGFPALTSNPDTHEYLMVYQSPDNSQLLAVTFTTDYPFGISGQPISGGEEPVYPAAAGGKHGFLIAVQDALAGFTVTDVFGALWGTRLYLPVGMKQ